MKKLNWADTKNNSLNENSPEIIVEKDFKFKVDMAGGLVMDVKVKNQKDKEAAKKELQKNLPKGSMIKEDEEQLDEAILVTKDHLMQMSPNSKNIKKMAGLVNTSAEKAFNKNAKMLMKDLMDDGYKEEDAYSYLAYLMSKV